MQEPGPFQQQQQQQQQHHDPKRRQEYEMAQRAAVESVLVGRATAEAVQHQGEQLRRAEDLADETQYILNRANRVLKGMTWGGWVSNMFTPDVKLPMNHNLSSSTASKKDVNLDQYDQFPESCLPAAQAMKNYHANVSVLEQCETEEQKGTCVQICNAMYAAVSRRMQEDLKDHPRLEAYRIQIKNDLEVLRKRQIASQNQVRGLDNRIVVTHTEPMVGSPAVQQQQQPQQQHKDDAKTKLFGRTPESGSLSRPGPAPAATKVQPLAPTTSQLLEQEQNQHLDVLAASLGELSHIAHSLNEGLYDQQDRIANLDTKSENVLETSKLVGRRTDRLIQKKSWTTASPVFCCHAMIRHVDSGKYLTALGKELWLMNQSHPINSKFRLYKRPTGSVLLGLQCEGSRNWIGQNWMTGGLACTATSLGRREEWQIDATITDWKTFQHCNTKLLIASAGWGQGGYLYVNEKYEIQIGTMMSDQQGRKAARWMLINCTTTDDDSGATIGSLARSTK